MPVAPVAATPISREKLLQVARALPADLQVLSALGVMLHDVNSELEEIARLLRRDVALASRIVRISNSAIFGGARIASVEEAVNRVGFSEILKLVGTATAASFAEHALASYGIESQELRDNMLYGAIAAESLARVAGMDTRSAYTAGLLRPLGLMVLDRASRGGNSFTTRYSATQWESYSAWEGTVFGIDHCDVAALILEEWRFPTDLCYAIRSHSLMRSVDMTRRLAVLLNVANGLAHKAGRSFPGEARWWDITPKKLAAVGLTEDQMSPAIVEMNIAFDAAVTSLAG